MDFEGGYPAELFVTPPQDVFNCSICLNTAKNPMRCQDEHIFCKKCIMTWISKGKHTCPNDRKNLNSKNLYTFRFAEHLIGEYCVQCVTTLPKDDFVIRKRKRSKAEKVKLAQAKKKKARKPPKSEEQCASKCEWTGNLCDLQSHIGRCPEATAECSWRDCDVKMLRKNITAHAAVCRHRLEPCELCGQKRKPSKRNIHKQRCPMTPVKCPNHSCTVMVRRCDVLEHRQSCPFELVPCLHKQRLNCNFMALRKDISVHSDDKLLHFDATVREIDRLRSLNDYAFSQLKEKNRAMYMMEFDIANLNEQLNQW